MFKCEKCGAIFEEPKTIPTRDPDTNFEWDEDVCPFCQWDEIVEGEICEQCGKFTEDADEGLCEECAAQAQTMLSSFMIGLSAAQAKYLESAGFIKND